MKHLVAVIWRDAHGSATSAFNEHEIPHAPLVITTYGLLLREDDAGVSVANEVCADGTFRGHTFVPKELITSVLDLGEPKAKRARKKKLDPFVGVG